MTVATKLIIRQGTPHDGPAIHRVLYEAVNDLAIRTGADLIPGDVQTSYARIEPLFRHLAQTAAEFWVAEDGSGEVIAYARSIEHGPFFELTELFVLPSSQSAGIGRQLLERAFPDDRGELRVIVATTDLRAVARYIKSGMTARTTIVSLIGTPQAPAGLGPSVTVERLSDGDAAFGEIRAMDAEIAGFDREDSFAWLAEDREALLFRRDGAPIGYAFVGAGGTGPIGARQAEDLAPILDEVLRRSAELEVRTVSLEVPMANGVALRHLLARGLRLDPFMTLLLSNREFGHMDRYLTFSPPIFL